MNVKISFGAACKAGKPTPAIEVKRPHFVPASNGGSAKGWPTFSTKGK